jgi:hypothetical protein
MTMGTEGKNKWAFFCPCRSHLIHVGKFWWWEKNGRTGVNMKVGREEEKKTEDVSFH